MPSFGTRPWHTPPLGVFCVNMPGVCCVMCQRRFQGECEDLKLAQRLVSVMQKLGLNGDSKNHTELGTSKKVCDIYTQSSNPPLPRPRCNNLWPPCYGAIQSVPPIPPTSLTPTHCLHRHNFESLGICCCAGTPRIELFYFEGLLSAVYERVC